jgi:hypothetical protein
MSLVEPLVGNLNDESNTSAKGPIQTLCMACSDERCNFKPMMLQRRICGEEDVVIDMKYCGVCHSDLHLAANHLGLKIYSIFFTFILLLLLQFFLSKSNLLK